MITSQPLQLTRILEWLFRPISMTQLEIGLLANQVFLLLLVYKLHIHRDEFGRQCHTQACMHHMFEGNIFTKTRTKRYSTSKIIADISHRHAILTFTCACPQITTHKQLFVSAGVHTHTLTHTGISWNGSRCT